MGPLERGARRFLRMRVLPAALLCALTFWFAAMVAGFRVTDPYLALGVVPGAAIFAFTVLLLVQRLTTATPPAFLQSVVERAELITLLVVANLMLVNFLAPVLGILALVPFQNPLIRRGLAGLGALSGRLLMWLFIAAVVGLIALILVRVFDRLVLRHEPARRLLRPLYYAALASVGVYWLYASVLIYNGSLDSGPIADRQAEVVGHVRIPGTGIAWVDVRSWDAPGRIKRVLLAPDGGNLTAGRVGAGQDVLVRVHPGFFRIEWVQIIRGDYTRRLDRLVEAVPSAAYPRKWLIDSLYMQRRWKDIADQAEAYLRYYPGDGAYALRVGRALEGAGFREEGRSLQARGGGMSPQIPLPWLPAAPVPPNLAARTPPAAAPRAVAPPGESARVLAREVAKLSGLDHHLGQLAEQARWQVERYAWRAKRQAELRSSVTPAFEREALVATAITLTAHALDDGRAPTLLSWLRSPLSRWIVILETDPPSTRDDDDYDKLVSNLAVAPPAAARIALVQRLDRAAGVTDLNAEARRTLRRAVAQAAARFLAESERSRFREDTDRPGRSTRPDEWARFDNITTMLLAYRSLSDDELGRYVEFFESPVGRWFSEVYRNSLVDAIRSAGSGGTAQRD